MTQWRSVVPQKRRLEQISADITAHRKKASFLAERGHALALAQSGSLVAAAHQQASEQEALAKRKENELREMTSEAMNIGLKLLLEIEPHQIELLLLVRKELRMPIDNERYRKQRLKLRIYAEENIQEAAEALKRSIE